MIMRKINYKLALFCLTVLAVLLFTPLFTHNVKAKDLDLIHEYNITCDVLDDATVKIKYHIVWEVLDSTKEGPLTWVKVGIPNAHVSNLKGKSDSIKKISQYSSGGDYVRIDLDRSYKAGETIDSNSFCRLSIFLFMPLNLFSNLAVESLAEIVVC